jgi:AcrR family transcriptional regulator
VSAAPPPAAGPRRRRVVTDVAQRRAEILDASVGVVLERGFAGTRISDVADALGISSGLVHYHFDSKDELLAETLRHAADADINRLEKAVAELDDPIRRLDRVLSEYLPETKKDQSWVIWVDAWGHAIRNERLRTILKELDLAWSGALESVLRDGVTAGVFECPDPAGTARRLSALLDGLGLDVILHGGPSRKRLQADARIAAATEIGLSPTDFP